MIEDMDTAIFKMYCKHLKQLTSLYYKIKWPAFFEDTFMYNNYENISEIICCNSIDRDIASSLVEAGLTKRTKTHVKGSSWVINRGLIE